MPVDHRQRDRDLLTRGLRQRLGRKQLPPIPDHQQAPLRERGRPSPATRPDSFTTWSVLEFCEGFCFVESVRGVAWAARFAGAPRRAHWTLLSHRRVGGFDSSDFKSAASSDCRERSVSLDAMAIAGRRRHYCYVKRSVRSGASEDCGSVRVAGLLRGAGLERDAYSAAMATSWMWAKFPRRGWRWCRRPPPDGLGWDLGAAVRAWRHVALGA
jgi:hypothetical protein